MSQTISISPSSAGGGVGFEVWMQRVIERAERVHEKWDSEGVHDLRVALRRCRTMAEALSQVNPDSGWRKIRKSSRDLFRALGLLRDAHVEREWVKRLAVPGDRVRLHLLRLLARREKLLRDAASKALEEFEEFSSKEWKKLARKLARKARLFPAESVVFQRLAFAKLDETSRLFAAARKSRSGASWHRARIGLKEFRYIAENFLPRKYAPWSAEIRGLQDQLGDVHDIEVLRVDLHRNRAKLDAAAAASWLEKIQGERKARRAEAIARTSGAGSSLLKWRSAFALAHTIASSPLLDRRSA